MKSLKSYKIYPQYLTSLLNILLSKEEPNKIKKEFSRTTNNVLNSGNILNKKNVN